jgi:hypothetical protein
MTKDEMTTWIKVLKDQGYKMSAQDGYIVAKRARLIQRLHAETWTNETGRRFAAACAEHVLDLIPDGEEKEVVASAIARAKELAAAPSHDADAQDQLELACGRAEEAAICLGKTSVAAARAANAAAEAARGYVSGPTAARQASKLARYARGDLMKTELEWQVTLFKASVEAQPDEH